MNKPSVHPQPAHLLNASRVVSKAPSWQIPKGTVFPDYTLTLQSPHQINGGK